MTALPQGFFLNTPRGQLFCLYHPPQGRCQGAILHLHPLAEELNNSRRVTAQMARALSASGYAVLQFDQSGCGDSRGDFADATWTGWLADAQDACQWLQAQHPGPLWLWGVRTGALLASGLLQAWHSQPALAPATPVKLLFWQAVTQGRLALQHWARLQSAAGWLGGATPEQPTARTPPQPSADGPQPWTVAGYTFNTALQSGLAQASLQPVTSPGGQRLVWLDVSTAQPPSSTPAALKACEAWRSQGWQVTTGAVAGPSYWQTIGMDDALELQTATLAALAHDR